MKYHKLHLAFLVLGCFAYSVHSAVIVEEEFRYRNGGGDIGTTSFKADGTAGGFGTYSNYDGVDELTLWNTSIHTGTGFNADTATGFVPDPTAVTPGALQASVVADENLWRAVTGGTGLSIYSGTGLVNFGVLDSANGGGRGGSLHRDGQNAYSSATRDLSSSAQAAATAPATTVYFGMLVKSLTNSDADNNEAGNFAFALSSADFAVGGATPLLGGADNIGIGFRAYSPDSNDPIDTTSAIIKPFVARTDAAENTYTDAPDENLYFVEAELFMLIGKIEWGAAPGGEPVPVLSGEFAEAALSITCPSETGYTYRLETSTDLQNWSFSGAWQEGTGEAIVFSRTPGAKEFYRVVVAPPTTITLYKIDLADAGVTYPSLDALIAAPNTQSVTFLTSVDSSLLDRITFYDNRKTNFDAIRIGTTPEDVAPGLIVPPAP